MSAHTAKQIRRRQRQRPDELGPRLEWEAALSQWADKKGVKTGLFQWHKKKIDAGKGGTDRTLAD